MKPFAERFPFLFHVTDRAALPGIQDAGLLSATGLCSHHRLDEESCAALLGRNRSDYSQVAPGAVLRWQGMPDGPLARRLAPGLDPVGWRQVINGKVFFFVRERDADRLRQREAARDQVVLRFVTADLLAAHLDLRACRYNNGFLDRRPRDSPRLRSADDYRPVAEWGAGVPSEVTVDGVVPSSIRFTVLSADGVEA